jgi:superfamily II DNA helicase RecQ
MRDQYEKLLEHFIDASLYINSYNSEDERKANEAKLQNGQILFAFVSPERLQIQILK